MMSRLSFEVPMKFFCVISHLYCS